MLFFFFKQKTAYEMRISDWSSDVCSSDLLGQVERLDAQPVARERHAPTATIPDGEREHAVETLDAGRTPGVERLEHDLGIAAGEEPVARSEERRVGKECGSTCRSRWAPYH